jgi:hypothetical protein
VRADIAAGKPIVIQVHVPLCDNSIIRCGGAGLGDGASLRRNLYWATSEGLAGWMDRRDSGWSPELRTTGAAIGEPDVLEVRVWRREVDVPAAWKGRGMPGEVRGARRGVRVARNGHRSSAVRLLCRPVPEEEPGSSATSKPAAPRGIVAWVGHNRLMDVAPNWTSWRARPHADYRQGTLAIACYSADYLVP